MTQEINPTTPTHSTDAEVHTTATAVHGDAATHADETHGETHAEGGHHFMQPQPDTIFHVGGIGITNSVLAMFVVVAGLCVFLMALPRTFKLVPGKIQSVLEMLMEFFLDAMIQAYGSEKRARQVLPWIITLFVLIAVMNQFMLIPILSAIKYDGTIHFLRISTSDWSMPIALALVSIVGSHLIALSINPLQHIGNYIKVGHFFHVKSPMDLITAFIEFFIGFIEMIGEVSKVVSLSARLFGNIFAGELMIVVVASIGVATQYIVPMPFVALGIFVGFLQAFVFSFLTMLFMGNTIASVRPRGEKLAHAH